MLNFSFCRVNPTTRSSSTVNKFLTVVLIMFCFNKIVAFTEQDFIRDSSVSKNIISMDVHKLTKRETVEKFVEEVEEVEEELEILSECIDTSTRCVRWAKRDYCTHKDYKRYMAVNCKASCNLCPEKDNVSINMVCKNDRKECTYWTKMGYCNKKTYRKFMSINCKLSCALCIDNINTTSITVTVPITSFVNSTTPMTTTMLYNKTTADDDNNFTATMPTTTAKKDTASTTAPITTNPAVLNDNITITLPVTLNPMTTSEITSNVSIQETTFKSFESTTTYITDLGQTTAQEDTTTITDLTTPTTTVETSPATCSNRLSTCKFLGKARCLTTSFMRLFCKVTCGLCQEDPQTTAAIPENTTSVIFTSPINDVTTKVVTPIYTTVTVPNVVKTTTQECVDEFAECAEISGFCGQNVNVTKKCRLTCGACQSTDNNIPAISTTPFPLTTAPITVIEQCEDTFPKCDELMSECNNSAYYSFLHVTCKRTCGLCPEIQVTTPSVTTETSTQISYNATECKDKSTVCPEWLKYGFCTSVIYPDMRNFMQNSCKQTCNLCGDDSWSEWSECNLSCGGGEKSRRRKCIGAECGSEFIVETITCNLQVCPAAPDKCSDRLALKACQQYQQNNACNTSVISALCQLTCGVCSNQGTQSDDGRPLNVTTNNGAVCRDINPRCANWTNQGLCTKNYTIYMQRHCPDSCGFYSIWQSWSEWSLCNAPCGSGLQTRIRTCASKICNGSNTESRPCNTFSCPNCFDSNPSCPLFEKLGKCREVVWKVMCRKTCGMCRAEPFRIIEGPCFDTREGCREAGVKGRCSEPQIATLCPNTCKRCTGSTASSIGHICEDQNPNCQFAATSGRCSDERVQTLCNKSCKLCTATIPVSPEILPSESSSKKVPENCVDQLSVCNALSENCNISSVRKFCPRSCNICANSGTQVQVTAECMDSDAACSQLAKLGQCSDELVAEKCKLSCNTCVNDGSRQLTIEPTTPTVNVCTNQISSCQSLVQFLNCTNPMVLRSCQKTCGICQSPTEIPKTLAVRTTLATVVAEECEDSHESCPRYAAEGLCQRNFYKFLCPISCRDCDGNIDQPANVCQDSLPSCKLLSSKCSVSYVEQLCKVTCNKCPGQVCEDLDEPVCDTLAELGMCTKSRFRKQCPKTCNVCGDNNLVTEETCKDTREDCASLGNNGYCQYQLISDVCPKTCSTCENSASTTLNTDKSNKDAESPCMDANDQCPAFKEMGQCRSTPSVQFFCAKTCDMCSTAADTKKRTQVNCIDENVDTCKKYSALCSFSSIANKCPVTCKKCEPVDQEGKSDTTSEAELLGTEECRDHLTQCNDFKGYCGVEKWFTYMDTMCPYTCSACDKIITTDSTAWAQWGAWSTWSECSKSCNDIPGPLSPESGGDTVRTRVCPEGFQCNGDSQQTAKCRKDYCPGINGNDTTVRCVDDALCEMWESEGRCRTVRFRDQMRLNCPIACKYCVPQLIWGNWSECDVTCGEGNQTRTKVCEAEGKCVDALGVNDTETQSCMMEPCDAWSKWSPWTKCSSTCGSGINLRIRICNKGEPGDKMCKGNYVEERICANTTPCPMWDSWSAWSTCSKKCDGGYKNRTRDCFHSSENATCMGDSKETDVCNEHSCTTWMQWSKWDSCSVPCNGNGTQSRTRVCPGLKGQCGDDSESREEQQCGTVQCSDWSAWGQWSLCSATCGGGGLQERSRSCEANGVCIGDLSDTRTCSSPEPCIRWSEWSKFSECSVSCGGGIMTKSRDCPIGSDVLTECPGNSTESVICNCKICPDTGVWSAWGDFGLCSVTCSGGKMLRRRICLNGIPGRGGCQGPSHDLLPCASEECPIGKWKEWSPWSHCSASCGSGIMFRDRNCIDGVVGVSGCAGSNETMEKCNEHECPSWSLWQPWSSCSRTCGEGGTRTRIKQCYDPTIEEVVTNESCGPSANIFEEESCNVRLCPAWSKWTGWGFCSSECGVGWTYRNRTCINGYPGEIGCEEGQPSERKLCNTWECAPVCDLSPMRLSSTDFAPANLFSASSEFLMYGASEARLDSDLAWCPETDDYEKWLEVDLTMPLEVTGIMIQGYVRNSRTALPKYTWVPRFSVFYSNYSNELIPIKDNADRTRLFQGPEGPLATVTRTWLPVIASNVRIQVLATNPIRIGCLRMELLTCKGSLAISDLGLHLGGSGGNESVLP